ncbi:MAG: DUF3179 domain-containing protein [Actinomycetota bacterium]
MRLRTLIVGLLVLLVVGVLVSLGRIGGRERAETLGEPRRSSPSPLIDEDRILSGGPPPDGIPPIDDPKFAPASDIDFLQGREPVLALSVETESRAYPLQILTWHEIVNDTVAGTPVAVTYCPLCNTGIAFVRPRIDGQLLDFGTSGKLYNSNLVMYDRQTESYWPQAMGKAVTGPLTGWELEFVPTQILSFADWRSEHPDGLVLTTETGFSRPYGENPYPGYDGSRSPYLFDGTPDDRLPALSRVLGLVGEDGEVAVPFERLAGQAREGWAVLELSLGAEPVVVFWHAGTASALDAEQIAQSRDVGAASAFTPEVDGRALSFGIGEEGITDEETGTTWSIQGRGLDGPLEGEQLPRVLAIDSFWFDWAAFHPATRIAG